MTAVRRHLAVLAWTVVGMHAVTAALNAADLCRERQHLHGGVAVHDCPMHHATDGGAQPMTHDAHQAHAQHHGHHASTVPPPVEDTGGARLVCRCSSDIPSILFGQNALPQVIAVYSPMSPPAPIEVWGQPMVITLHPSPPSPPPR